MKNEAVIAKSKWWNSIREAVASKVLPVTGDFMLVEALAEEEMVTSGGIVIPKVSSYRDTSHDHKTDLALVLAVGPGQYLDDGSLIPPNHEPGDVVSVPVNVEWYTQFFGVDCSKARIGRLRDIQVPMSTPDIAKLRGILSGHV